MQRDRFAAGSHDLSRDFLASSIKRSMTPMAILSRARRRLIAAPIPAAAPVTNATFIANTPQFLARESIPEALHDSLADHDNFMDCPSLQRTLRARQKPLPLAHILRHGCCAPELLVSFVHTPELAQQIAAYARQ